MVPEGRGIFTRMTVLENLQMGAWLRRDSGGGPAGDGAKSSPTSRAWRNGSISWPGCSPAANSSCWR